MKKKGQFFKITFELPEEEEGFPPSKYESLWALPHGKNKFIIDNIPFYIQGISSGDVISASCVKGEWIYEKLIRPSGNSTFRLYVFEEKLVQQVRQELSKIGCQSEVSDIPNLIAVEIPAEVTINPFLDYIVNESEKGLLEYQEAALRHPLPE